MTKSRLKLKYYTYKHIYSLIPQGGKKDLYLHIREVYIVWTEGSVLIKVDNYIHINHLKILL